MLNCRAPYQVKYTIMPTTAEKQNSQALDYRCEYRLDRDYFTECFDESKPPSKGLHAYRKAALLLITALGLSFTEISPYAFWFLLAMAGVEFLSVRYQRSWWITRQMFSRAAGSQIQLTLSDEGMSTESPLYQQCISWAEITEIDETEHGFIITYTRGRNYLSKQALSLEASDYLRQKSPVASVAR